MRFRKTILTLCMLTLALPTLAGDAEQGFSTEDMQKVMERAKKYQSTVKLPETSNPGMEKAARELNDYYNSPAYQARIQQYTEKLKRQLEKDNPQVQGYKKLYSKANTREKSSILLPSERIYVFISSSVPMATLRQYAYALDKLDDPGVVMVMRGFVGGMKSIKPTYKFIQEVLNLDFENRTGVNATVEIDPLLFRRYGIERVPAVVFADGVTVSNREASEGLKDNAGVRNAYVVYGDMSLKYDLNTIYRETGNPQILDLKRKLERGYYR